MAKHQADGIYYLDKKLLVERHACDFKLAEFVKMFGPGQTMVTQDMITRCVHAGGMVGWLSHAMPDANMPADERDMWSYMRRYEYNTRGVVHSPAAASHVAKLFMDALLLRAKREGRIK